MANKFYIDYNNAGIHYDEQIKQKIIKCVKNSPLANELEWLKIDGEEWEGIGPKGANPEILYGNEEKRLVVYASDIAEAITGDVGSDWEALALQILTIMSETKNTYGEPLFSETLPLIEYYENVTLPEELKKYVEQN